MTTSTTITLYIQTAIAEWEVTADAEANVTTGRDNWDEPAWAEVSGLTLYRTGPARALPALVRKALERHTALIEERLIESI